MKKGLIAIIGGIVWGQLMVGFSLNLATKSETLMTVDSISGTVNGKTFKGIGEGIAYLEEGREIGHIVFDDPPPPGFIPMYGKSWKCKCHKKIALPEPDAINLYRYGDYEVHSRMTYPTGDVITTFAEIKNWEDPEVHRKPRCLMVNGNYTGRTDAIAVLPYEAVMYPAGPGKIVEKGTRYILMSDSTIMEVQKLDTIFLLDTNATLPFKEIITYTPLSFEWSDSTLYSDIKTTIRRYEESAGIGTFPKVSIPEREGFLITLSSITKGKVPLTLKGKTNDVFSLSLYTLTGRKVKTVWKGKPPFRL